LGLLNGGASVLSWMLYGEVESCWVTCSFGSFFIWSMSDGVERFS